MFVPELWGSGRAAAQLLGMSPVQQGPCHLPAQHAPQGSGTHTKHKGPLCVNPVQLVL